MKIGIRQGDGGLEIQNWGWLRECRNMEWWTQNYDLRIRDSEFIIHDKIGEKGDCSITIVILKAFAVVMISQFDD